MVCRGCGKYGAQTRKWAAVYVVYTEGVEVRKLAKLVVVGVVKRTPPLMDVSYTGAATCFFFFVVKLVHLVHNLHWYMSVGRCAWRGEEGAVMLGPVTKHFCKSLSRPAPTVSAITSAP